MIENTQLIIFRRKGLRPELFRWALSTFHHVRLAPLRPAPPFVRDAEAIRFLEGSSLPWLMFLSGDHAWTSEAEPLLRSPEPVAGCRYVDARQQEVHPQVGIVGIGCIRIHRDVLKKIPPPWFTQLYQREKIPWLHCSCEVFSSKLRSIGILPKKVGSLGHQITVVAFLNRKLIPDENGCPGLCHD